MLIRCASIGAALLLLLNSCPFAYGISLKKLDSGKVYVMSIVTKIFLGIFGCLVLFVAYAHFTYDGPTRQERLEQEARAKVDAQVNARIAEDKAQAAREKARAEARANRPAVRNSKWDGGVRQVEDYLERHLKDPDSVEYIEWSPVAEIPEGFQVRVKYRAKNSYGGYVIEEKLFRLTSEGQITSVTDFPR